MHLCLHEYCAGVDLPTEDAQHVSRGVAHILGVFRIVQSLFLVCSGQEERNVVSGLPSRSTLGVSHILGGSHCAMSCFIHASRRKAEIDSTIEAGSFLKYI